MVGDGHGVFELGRQGAIACDDRPAIVKQDPAMRAGVDHRFNCEDHARPKFWSGIWLANMGNRRRLVQLAADAMPTPFAHHVYALRFRVVLDDHADLIKLRARLCGLNTQS